MLQDDSIVLTPVKDSELTLDSMLFGITPDRVGGELDWGDDVGVERYE